MKSVRISVFFLFLILLLSLTTSTYAIQISFSDLHKVDYSQFRIDRVKKGESFLFTAELTPSDYNIPLYWSADVLFADGIFQKGVIEAGTYLVNDEIGRPVFQTSRMKAELIEKPYEKTLDRRFTFEANFDASGLTGHRDVWSIYLDLLLPVDGDVTRYVGYLSGIDPDHLKPVPEPGTMMLMGTGLFCIAAVRRRLKK